MTVQTKLKLFDEDEQKAVVEAADILARKNVSLEKIVDMSDTDLHDTIDEINEEEEKRRNFAGNLFECDPSQPLPERREEDFVQIYIATNKGHVAYRDAFQSTASVKTCSQQASRTLRRPKVAARLRWLQREKWRREKKMLEDMDFDGPMTKAQKIRICENIAKDTTAAVTDRVRALEMHNKLTGDEEENEKSLADLDPTELCDYFKKAEKQGLDVADLARKRAEQGDDEGEKERDDVGHSEGIDPQDVVVSG